VGVDEFGGSTKGEELYEKFGITVERVINAVKEVINKVK